jgi:P-type Ca2+ transporter type 2C
MLDKVTYKENNFGLQEDRIPALQQRFGKNIFSLEKERRFVHILLEIVKEPMFLLLIAACIVYFVLGKTDEGFMMAAAMFLVAVISVYQDIKSTRALKALKELTAPMVTVLRDGIQKTIASTDLVPGDVILLEEGNKITADAMVIQENDLSIDESVITGESIPVEKSDSEGNNLLYQGTTINTGKCYAVVTAIGNNTVLGKLGKAVSSYTAPKTLLQQQIGMFVRMLAIFGVGAFCIIWLVNYFKTGDVVLSLLFGLTLAMASIPEEIPVAFSFFMALGAYQMSRLGIITRQPQTIENLGAVSVICLDKTGTITENKMQVKIIYDFETDSLIDFTSNNATYTGNVLEYAVLASEVNPFDAMEKTLIALNKMQFGNSIGNNLKMIYEYPLQGQPPMMTHVYEVNGKKIVAAKGAAERIIAICNLDNESVEKINHQITSLTSNGYRLLGVSSAIHPAATLPKVQDDFNWKFEGLVALYDAPKKDIAVAFKEIYNAKIDVKIITGDYAATAVNIAGQAGVSDYLKFITGNEVMQMTAMQLQDAVKRINIFARMFPDAKLKVIEALKANGEIVAMAGDGVNDAPALKAAHIGIAMGKRGTEMARQASDLILTDDNASKILEAIKQGRKIFSNLKKAIRYVISIHIPIILTAALPLLLGWKYQNIFSPVHIIFLEIIMGPTCSVFFEREPVEANIMKLPPRKRDIGMFSFNELLISITQGIIITIGILMLYYVYMSSNHSLQETRTMVFTTLVLANIFLTFTNRSFTQNFIKTIRYKNNLVIPVFIISISFLAVIHLVPQARTLFELTTISSKDFMLSIGVAFSSVFWFEAYKTNLTDLIKPKESDKYHLLK